MFNLKSYESKMKTNQQLLDRKNSYMAFLQKKSKKQKYLVKKYKKRINKYVMDELSGPQEVHQYEAPRCVVHRDCEPQKWLGRGIISCKGFVSEKQRIAEQQFLNQQFCIGQSHDCQKVANYDYRPSVKSDAFQQPKLRFKEKTAIERLVIKLQHQKQVTLMKSGKNEKKSAYKEYKEKNEMLAIMNAVNKEQKEKSNKSLHKPGKQTAISLLLKKMIPGLGVKHYFKSTQTLGYHLPSSLIPNKEFKEAALKRKRHNQTYNAIGMAKRDGNMCNRSHSERVRKSKKVLLARGILGGNTSLKLKTMTMLNAMHGKTRIKMRRKKEEPNTKTQKEKMEENYDRIVHQILQKQGLASKKKSASRTLHPGEGHTLPFSNMSTRKVYEDVYPDYFTPKSFYGKSYVDGLKPYNLKR